MFYVGGDEVWTLLLITSMTPISHAESNVVDTLMKVLQCRVQYPVISLSAS
uniref:Uncharacterized protein n=1 Tax=Arion vulgaris TaxID=1028688 RepID=A0A0B6Y738_9EUPU